MSITCRGSPQHANIISIKNTENSEKWNKSVSVLYSPEKGNDVQVQHPPPLIHQPTQRNSSDFGFSAITSLLKAMH